MPPRLLRKFGWRWWRAMPCVLPCPWCKMCDWNRFFDINLLWRILPVPSPPVGEAKSDSTSFTFASFLCAKKNKKKKRRWRSTMGHSKELISVLVCINKKQLSWVSYPIGFESDLFLFPNLPIFLCPNSGTSTHRSAFCPLLTAHNIKLISYFSCETKNNWDQRVLQWGL